MKDEKLGELLCWSPELEKAYWDVLDNSTRLGDCIVYGGKPNNSGYGYVKVKGKNIGAHRIVLVHGTGKDPKNLQAGHTCGNRACVSLEHLVWVSGEENCRMREAERFLQRIRTRIGRNSGVRSTEPIPSTVNPNFLCEGVDLSALFE